MTWLYAGLALLSGAALAVQVGLNNGLKERMGHPLPSALCSFATGTLALFTIALALRPPLPKSASFEGSPWWIWLGVVVTGQILTSVLLDHYGLFGFKVHEVGFWRVVGVVLLLAGAAIVLRS
jgi:transporter family-2 protein